MAIQIRFNHTIEIDPYREVPAVKAMHHLLHRLERAAKIHSINRSDQTDPRKKQPLKEEITTANKNRYAPAAITVGAKRKRFPKERKEVEAVMVVTEEEIATEEMAAVEINK
jgi:hypothetical protein